MCREMNGLAYAKWVGEQLAARAMVMALPMGICGFWTFFTIVVGVQRICDVKR